MIVQCNVCGAPLDVAGKSGSVVCAYCRSKQRVRALTVQAPQTPQGWHPPPTWASPAGQYVYRPVAASSGAYRAIGPAVFFALSCAAAGVYVLLDQVRSQSRRTTSREEPAVAVETRPNAEPVSLLVDPREALAAFAAQFGARAELLSLTLYTDHALAEVALPGGRDEVRRYAYLVGRGIGRSEISVRLAPDIKPRLALCLFSLDSVDPASVGRVVEDARTAATDAALSELTLQSCPLSSAPTWTAVVGRETPRYDLSGRRLAVPDAAAPPGVASPARPGAPRATTPRATQPPSQPPGHPPSQPKTKGACGCSTGDLMCIMRCSKRK
ncbi:MAG: hypothetical protein HY908_21530 [Myxococcales bacterium]|nr:hypothetical protein [Myxococcales bacterium]